MILYYDSTHVAQVDSILDSWKDKCGDLFDKNIYSPGFFSSNPLMDIISDISKKQSKSKENFINDNMLTEKQIESMESISSHFLFTFFRGALQSIKIIPTLNKRYQYKYNGTSLFWDNSMPLHKIEASRSLLGKDSVKIYSGYYEKDYASRNYTEEKYTPTRLILTKKEYPELSQSAVMGEFTFDQEAFSVIPKGSAAKNWALNFAINGGIGLTQFTKELKDDQEINSGNVNIDWNGTIGAIHCDPTSGRCFGFGAGYGGSLWVGSGDVSPEDRWRGEESEEKTKRIDGIRVYGEYYLKGKAPYGFREAITIPMNANSKYLESRTSFFKNLTNINIEIGLAISPMQYIPMLFFNIGYNFVTSPF